MSAAPHHFLRRPEVEARVGLATSTVYRLMKSNDFPLPYKIGTGRKAAVAWLEREIEEWIAKRLARTVADRKSGRHLPNSPPRWKKCRGDWSKRATKNVAVVCVKPTGTRSLFGRYASEAVAKSIATALNRVGLVAEIRTDVDATIRLGQKVAVVAPGPRRGASRNRGTQAQQMTAPERRSR